MSAETESDTHTQPMTTTPFYSSESGDSNSSLVNDVVLWRRKKLNATILTAATAIWVLMEAYQFKFLTVFSWLAIFVVASIFLFANMTRLLGKDPPNLSRLELTEETAMGMANTLRLWIEEGIRLLFRVSAEGQWQVFVGVVVGLLLLSYAGSFMDLLTFLYTGIIVGLTVPVTYTKNEDKIKRVMDWLRGRCKRSYEIIDEKAIKKITSRVMNGNQKQNKNGMKKTE